MKTITRIWGALAVLLTLTGPAFADTYVSLTGDFYFDYPADWMQVDNRIVDTHLRANQAGAATLDFEAAFSPITSAPFFVGPYFILTVDTSHGPFSQTQVESAVADMGRKFGSDIRYFPVADFLSDMRSDAPSYDAQTRTVSVIVDIVERGQVVKKNLLVQRFHDRGLATFYFYAPDSVFEAVRPVFNQVLASFHSGNAEQALPKEALKVADIPTDGPSESPSRRRPVVFWGSTVVILIIAFAVIRRRRKSTR